MLFYEEHFGMRLIHRQDLPAAGVSHYFMERPRDGQTLPLQVPSPESEEYFRTSAGCCLELVHRYGTESDPSFKGYWSGNAGRDLPRSNPLYMEGGPVRGFGHIAFNVDDVYAFSASLERAGVKFQKRPSEGRMRGLAFALDPDGYWVEIVARRPGLFSEPCNLSQVMLRVKDGPKTVKFYRDMLGMVFNTDMGVPGDFTNYFMMSVCGQEKCHVHPREMPWSMWQPALELTHNHGTERDPSFQVHTGSIDPEGFGHIGFLVDDLAAMCQDLKRLGVTFECGPGEDAVLRNAACILDPSGYRVKLIQRGPPAADLEPPESAAARGVAGVELAAPGVLGARVPGAAARRRLPGLRGYCL